MPGAVSPSLPVATAFSHVVDFLWHREGNADRGVLGVDVGAASTTMAATFEGRSYISVYEHGVANGLIEWVEAPWAGPHHALDPR